MLQHYATAYNSLADRYHSERFTNRPGRYDFEEATALARDLVVNLLAGYGGGWRLLDVATGTGKIAVAVAGLGGQVVGVDSALGMLEQCAANREAAGVREHLSLNGGNAGHLPYRDNSFDMVFSSRFLHLLPREVYPEIIGEMVRVVKPGGYVAVEVKNPWYGVVLHRVKDLLQVIPEHGHVSTYVSGRGLSALAEEIEGASLYATMGLLLPRGWYLMDHPQLAQVARSLARQPLKSISGYLYAVFQKDKPRRGGPTESEGQAWNGLPENATRQPDVTPG